MVHKKNLQAAIMTKRVPMKYAQLQRENILENININK